MDERTFWQMIEDTRRESGGDLEGQVSLLEEKLLALPAQEIIAFDRLCEEMRFRAYRWDLWGAAYIINSGCSDDGFDYFRGWLIAQGQTVYENALRDPDTLAGVLTGEEEEVECEEMLYVAARACEEKTSEEMPMATRAYPEIAGEPWEEDDLPALFPRLARKFGWEEEGEDEEE